MTRRAFTLLEVMIAAGIAAMIFTAMFAGFSVGFTMLRSTRENLRATQILLSRMEGLRLCTWGTNQLFNTDIVPVNFTDYYYPVGVTGSGSNVLYYGKMTVTQNPSLSPSASYQANMALITVTVTWTNMHYKVENTLQRSMSTYVARYGIQKYVYAAH